MLSRYNYATGQPPFLKFWRVIIFIKFGCCSVRHFVFSRCHYDSQRKGFLKSYLLEMSSRKRRGSHSNEPKSDEISFDSSYENKEESVSFMSDDGVKVIERDN